jgi:hypothetical protein
MKSAIAYVLMFLLGPFVGGIGSIVLMPVILGVCRATTPAVGGIVGGVVQSFLAVWVGTIIFGWFELKPSLLMLVVLGAGFLLFDLNRYATRGPSSWEIGCYVGHIGGLVLAAAVLL